MDVFIFAEEVLAVMLDIAADRGGRAALKVPPTSQDVDVFAGNRRPPGSSVKSRLIAPAQFGAKKRHPYPSLLPGQAEWMVIHHAAELRQ